jgi:hypothetical protein
MPAPAAPARILPQVQAQDEDAIMDDCGLAGSKRSIDETRPSKKTRIPSSLMQAAAEGHNQRDNDTAYLLWQDNTQQEQVESEEPESILMEGCMEVWEDNEDDEDLGDYDTIDSPPEDEREY